MKRIRKVLVLAMTLIMVMALNITAFAEGDVIAPTGDTATITIQGLTQNTTITYKQILKNSETGGWQIVDDAAIKAIFDAFKTDNITDPIEGYKAATESARAEAFKDVTCTDTTGVNGSTITVTEAGLYLIQAVDSTGEYVYKKMIASVGFEYDENGNGKLKNPDPINAKKSKTTIDKKADGAFKEIIEDITYTVDVVIPFVPKGATPADGNDYLVTIKDVLKNGNYKAENGIASVGYTLDRVSGTIEVPVTTISDTSESIVVPLDQFIKNADGVITNENADKTITLTYVATGKGSVIDNTVTPSVWGVDRTPSSYKVVTGKIQVTKFGATESVKLKDAKFVILKGTQYAQLSNDGVLTGWTDDIKQATPIITNADGVAEAKGFDREETYTAKEFSAPNGYTLKDESIALTWSTDDTTTTTGAVVEEQLATGSITDDVLSELPYTGGSGTAVFTAIGVLLMSVAAGLYFASKRKVSK